MIIYIASCYLCFFSDYSESFCIIIVLKYIFYVGELKEMSAGCQKYWIRDCSHYFFLIGTWFTIQLSNKASDVCQAPDSASDIKEPIKHRSSPEVSVSGIQQIGKALVIAGTWGLTEHTDTSLTQQGVREQVLETLGPNWSGPLFHSFTHRWQAWYLPKRRGLIFFTST